MAGFFIFFGIVSLIIEVIYGIKLYMSNDLWGDVPIALFFLMMISGLTIFLGIMVNYIIYS